MVAPLLIMPGKVPTLTLLHLMEESAELHTQPPPSPFVERDVINRLRDFSKVEGGGWWLKG